MGTRSLTVMQQADGTEIAVLYRQMDGYPDGHGKDLADFLKGRKVVNGIGDSDKHNFNGAGCLAASIISHFKNGIGSFYLHPAGTRDTGEEYIYTVGIQGDAITLLVEAGYPPTKPLYDGPVDDYAPISESDEEE